MGRRKKPRNINELMSQDEINIPSDIIHLFTYNLGISLDAIEERLAKAKTKERKKLTKIIAILKHLQKILAPVSEVVAEFITAITPLLEALPPKYFAIALGAVWGFFVTIFQGMMIIPTMLAGIKIMYWLEENLKRRAKMLRSEFDSLPDEVKEQLTFKRYSTETKIEQILLPDLVIDYLPASFIFSRENLEKSLPNFILQALPDFDNYRPELNEISGSIIYLAFEKKLEFAIYKKRVLPPILHTLVYLYAQIMSKLDVLIPDNLSLLNFANKNPILSWSDHLQEFVEKIKTGELWEGFVDRITFWDNR